MDEQANPLQRDHSLRVVLPGGLEKNATVHGSKPVMDLLVTLCASYHLNPSDHTVEFLSANKNSISFKPNSPIGSLEAEKMVLKPKGAEDKGKRPYMPEATVRLLINYNKSHKTVLRVNPRLPLELLLPAVCHKCELDAETTVLLRDSQSQEPLDLKRSLNDHGLREVFAKDSALKSPAAQQHGPSEAAAVEPMVQTSTPHSQEVTKSETKKKSRGFFSLFRRNKKKHLLNGTVSAPASPGRDKRMGSSPDVVPAANTLPANVNLCKKRRAPQPPAGASPSISGDLSTSQDKEPQVSGEASLRSTKRRAPPPPSTSTSTSTSQEPSDDADGRDSLYTLEETRESEESRSLNPSLFSNPSPPLSQRHSSSSSPRHPSLPYTPEEPKPHTPSFLGKDLSDARSALAKVLTSSVSKGTLARRLRNSASFPKFNVSSCISNGSEKQESGDAGPEPESVLSLVLPTEVEDPVQRKGLTTFTVTPVRKPSDEDSEEGNYSGEEEIHPADGITNEPPPDICQLNLKDDPTDSVFPKCTEDKMFSETPSEASDPPVVEVEEAEVTSELELADPPSPTDEEAVDPHMEDEEILQSSHTDARADEPPAQQEVPKEEEISFPPPPPPVFFKEDNDASEDSPAAPPPAGEALNGHTDGLIQDSVHDSASAVPEPAVERKAGAPSRFAQAVATAVRRSRIHGLGQTFSPQVSGQSSARSSYQHGA